MESLRRTVFLASLVVVGVALRIMLAEYPNFAPVGALALFAGASFNDKKLAFIVPLVVMLITDWMIGFHPAVLYVYFAMAVYAGLGIWAGDGMQISRLVSATLAGSVSFFLITNFGFFIGFCPKTWQGFVDCYAMALPFFRHTLISDFLFGTIFFSALAFAEQLSPRFRPAVNLKSDH